MICAYESWRPGGLRIAIFDELENELSSVIRRLNCDRLLELRNLHRVNLNRTALKFKYKGYPIQKDKNKIAKMDLTGPSSISCKRYTICIW